jgi:hypothetical protein
MDDLAEFAAKLIAITSIEEPGSTGTKPFIYKNAPADAFTTAQILRNFIWYGTQ